MTAHIRNTLILLAILLMTALPASAGEFVSTLSSEDGAAVKVDLSKYALTTPEGESAGTLADFDKYIYVDVWATWCRPCVNEMPHLAETQERLGGDNFTIIGLSIDDHARMLQDFFKINEKHYPIYHDANAWKARFVQDFGIQGIPALFLFSPDGRLIGRDFRGPGMADAVEQAIKFDGKDVSLRFDFELSENNYDKLIKIETHNLGGQMQPVPVAQGAVPVSVTAVAESGIAGKGERLDVRFFAISADELMTINPETGPVPDWTQTLKDGKLSRKAEIPKGTMLFAIELALVSENDGSVISQIRELWGTFAELGPQQ